MGVGARWVIAVLLGLLLGFLVLREAFVTAFAARQPAQAAMLWPTHPAVLLESGLAEIGEAAAAGKPADAALVNRLIAVSADAPLLPEPFVVRGVQARVADDEALAGRAFLAARERNPRFLAARYFLADHYLRTGETREGLSEIAALARLLPQSLPEVAPHLASYARTPGVAPQVKAMIQKNPLLEAALLNRLASDANDSRLALYLWNGRSDAGASQWQSRMLDALVTAGRFEEAAKAWTRFSGGLVAGRLDPDFRQGRLAPFGWTLASDSSGVAEAQGQGRLHVLFYGREDKVLAGQMLTLAPGRYRLSMRLSGTTPTAGSLAWTLRCLPSSAQILDLPLDRPGKGGALAGEFVVPSSGCRAQQLELKGTAPDFAEQSEATVANLNLDGGG